MRLFFFFLIGGLDKTRTKDNWYVLIQATIKGLANNAKNMYKIKILKNFFFYKIEILL